MGGLLAAESLAGCVVFRRRFGEAVPNFIPANASPFRHPGEGRDPFPLPCVIPVSAVIPAKAGIHFACALHASRSFVPVGLRPPSLAASHFLCLHKESNQRNAPSVTRRPRSGRFAAVGRVWRQGSCPVAKCGPSWPAPRAAHAASSGRPSPLHRGSTSRAAKPKLLRQEPRSSFASRVPLQVAASRWRKSPKGRRQDAGEFADSTWTYCRQTPEPARAVTRAGMPA